MPFEQLGLGDDATERDVRRAYAARLKKTRPDDDPVAFQALHEAYQACLEELRYRASEGQMDWDEDELPGLPRQSEPLPGGVASEAIALSVLAEADQDPVDDQPDPFDLSGFLEELYAKAGSATPAVLKAWLAQHPALYSIRLKSAITAPVLNAVATSDPPMQAELQDVVADFFGLHHLGPADWWLVERMHRSKARAEASRRFAAGHLPRANPQEKVRYFDRLMDRPISRRRWHWSNYALMLVPGFPDRLHQRLEELDNLTEGASLELVDPRLRTLVGKLHESDRMNRQRIALTWSRALVAALFLACVQLLSLGKLDPVIFAPVAVIAASFTGWQALLAGYHSLRRRMVDRGLGHRWRELSALVLLLLALATGLFPKLSPLAGYALAIAGTFRAITLARWDVGWALVLVVGAAVGGLASLELVVWPLPVILVALCMPGLVALAVDRLRSLYTGRSVDALAEDSRWLQVTSLALLLLLITIAAVTAVTRS